jgi:hypothetical protein
MELESKIIKPSDIGKPESEADIKFNCFSKILVILKERRTNLLNDTVRCWGYISSMVDQWMSTKHRWRDLTQEIKVFEDESVPVPLCHNTFHAADLRVEPALRGERPASINLTHGTGTRCDQHDVYVMHEHRLSTVVTDMIIRWQK